MSLAVVDYGVGNLNSILNMLKRIGVEATRAADSKSVREASSLILPGVGHFDACIDNFTQSGLREVVEARAQEGLPILGICVGAQMMTRGSEEGQRSGLGWVEGETVRFSFPNSSLKVPHMGWTDIEASEQAPLFQHLPEEPRFYFAHSFHFRLDRPERAIAQAHYGYDFVCAFNKANLFGVQFHPEKSHRFGMKLLENFAGLTRS